MGNSSSSEAKSLMEVVNTSITNISESTTADGYAYSKAANSFKFVNKGNIECEGSLSITQANSSNQKATVSSTMTSQSALETALTTDLTNKVSQLTTQQQEALSTGMNCGKTVSDIETNVTNFVQNNLSKSAASSVKAFVDQLNKGIFINGPGATIKCGQDGITVDQSNISDQVVELVAKSLFTSDIGIAIGTAADNLTEQVTDQKLEGLGGIVKSLMAVLGGGMLGMLLLMMCPAIVLICCICLCCGRKKSAFGKKKNSFIKVL
jgi:hypothetical protein